MPFSKKEIEPRRKEQVITMNKFINLSICEQALVVKHKQTTTTIPFSPAGRSVWGKKQEWILLVLEP